MMGGQNGKQAETNSIRNESEKEEYDAVWVLLSVFAGSRCC